SLGHRLGEILEAAANHRSGGCSAAVDAPRTQMLGGRRFESSHPPQHQLGGRSAEVVAPDYGSGGHRFDSGRPPLSSSAEDSATLITWSPTAEPPRLARASIPPERAAPRFARASTSPETRAESQDEDFGGRSAEVVAPVCQ